MRGEPSVGAHPERNQGKEGIPCGDQVGRILGDMFGNKKAEQLTL